MNDTIFMKFISMFIRDELYYDNIIIVNKEGNMNNEYNCSTMDIIVLNNTIDSLIDYNGIYVKFKANNVYNIDFKNEVISMYNIHQQRDGLIYNDITNTDKIVVYKSNKLL